MNGLTSCSIVKIFSLLLSSATLLEAPVLLLQMFDEPLVLSGL